MSDSIGEQLRQAREARKITIAKAAEATRIRARFLDALELDDFESLPSPVQVRGFLRIYAEFLGIEPHPLIELYNGERKPQDILPSTEKVPTLRDDLVSLPVEEIETEINFDEEPAEIQQEEKVSEGSEKPQAQSQSIFNEIGEQLRTRRELLSLTVDEIERHTHVRKVYLHALETGKFDDLPSPVQARGMLHNYARFLDMDVDAILLRFADALQVQRSERHPQKTPRDIDLEPQQNRLRFPPAIRQFLSGDLIFGVVLVIVLAAFIIWGSARVLTLQSQSNLALTAPSISDILLATEEETPDPTATPAPESDVVQFDPDQPSPTAQVPTLISQARVQVYVIALERTWIRVTIDGNVRFEGRVQEGNAYPYEGNQQIEILTGNAAALEIIFNQQNLGVMGFYGEVVNRIYTPNGVLFPTPSATPSPSNTPRVTVTPTRTSTPQATQPGQ